MIILFVQLGDQERTGCSHGLRALARARRPRAPLTRLCVPESHHRFDPAKSSTFRDLGEPLSIQYGTGSMEGVLGTDTVIVSDLPPRLLPAQTPAPAATHPRCPGSCLRWGGRPLGTAREQEP